MAASTAPALPEQAGLNSLPSSLPRIDVRGDSPAADQPRIRRSITLDSTPAKQKMAKAQLRSCGVAQRHLLPGVEHRQSRYLNNRAEDSHRPTRRRERQMQRFKSSDQAQNFLSAHSFIYGHFHPRRHRLAAG